ncbi:hypothetical protein HZY83_02795 [Gemella sp. GH3]|uniref:hypothetical protein n=1 Tax=unclassified Gemella TaxID=2624949 RepID=UPI0015CFE220|nr:MULTISPECIES: hypothetical protein [unclassified Gemella]MBF0713608.1 hypothetical protein [Gemella sp. GH3.1]NYS50560.1 hypothetical protein [Gemella sp. GH3]
MYLQETKNLDINELEQIIVNPSYLINITKKHFSKVRYMNEEVIKNLVKSFVYNYTILNKKLIIS